MVSSQQSKFLPYLNAIGSVGLAFLLSWLFHPWISATPSPFFYAAVVIMAWYGGLAPALVCAVLSAAARQALLMHYHVGPVTFSADDIVQIAVFLFLACLIGALFRIVDRQEQALLAAKADLEHQVEERTRELTTANRQLVDAIAEQRRIEEERQKMEDVARSRERLALLGELAAGVAHELRNPLQGVMSYLQLLKLSASSPEEMKQVLQQMEEGLAGIDSVAARLLDLSRHDFEPTVASALEPIVEKSCAFFQFRAAKQGVTLQRCINPDLPEVQANPTQLIGILLNLIKNSLDACARGGTISIHAHPHVKKPDMVEVVVSDTGHGIPATIRDRMFEPFFTTKPPGKGTGLGLAMAKRIVEGYGGYITILETGSSGTSISLGLPIATAQNAKFELNGEIVA